METLSEKSVGASIWKALSKPREGRCLPLADVCSIVVRRRTASAYGAGDGKRHARREPGGRVPRGSSNAATKKEVHHERASS